MRFKNFTREEAEKLAEDVQTLPLTLVSVKNLLRRALQIGLAHNLAVYDSRYIVLAEYYKFPRITADTKQEAAAQAVGVPIKSITDF